MAIIGYLISIAFLLVSGSMVLFTIFEVDEYCCTKVDRGTKKMHVV